MANQSQRLISLLLAIFIFTSTCNASISTDSQHSRNSLSEEEQQQQKPNIVIIVADDAGWNDFSFHGSPQIPTPNIDTLAFTGVTLNNYYASPLCTPSRGALMTGKHAIHIKLQHYVIMGGSEFGLPLQEKILPQYLKELGYSTHLIGKWHLGHARKEYTPTYRGFDTHFGYWLGMQDYYDHFGKDKYGFGYDFRSNMSVHYEAFGRYSTDLFTEEAVRIIDSNSRNSENSHEQQQPFLLMITHVAPHSSNPYRSQQAPGPNVDKFKDTIPNVNRRMFAGVVDKLDESVGRVVEALSKNNLLNNTIIIFSSDNGGAPDGFDLNYGSNYPLRGAKNTLWEGGIRMAGFIWSSVLTKSNAVLKNLMHIQDWVPTLYEAIGEDPSKLEGIDGISQWSLMKGVEIDSATNVRTELLHNIDDIYNNSGIRIGKWKLIQGSTSVPDLACGNASWDGWYGTYDLERNISAHELLPQIINSRAALALKSSGFILNQAKMELLQKEAQVLCAPVPPTSVTSKCNPYYNPCLFNIEEDPCEYYNLADENPAIVQSLLSTLELYNSTAVTPIPRVYHQESLPKNWGYIWTNWKDMILNEE